MDELIGAAFRDVQLRSFYLEGPRILTYVYEGSARA
jgi:hypothetical protein